MKGQGMCPHCCGLFVQTTDLVPEHSWSQIEDDSCPGSEQNWRNPESDGRPLWNGESNPHYYRNKEAM